MPEQDPHLPWTQAGWWETAGAWIREKLQRNGLAISGEIEVLHQRPWSAFARVPTPGGTVYFKAPAPPMRFEAGLTAALARWRPDCTLPIIAVDLDRGWMLTRDAGVTLRSLIQSPTDLAYWDEVLPLYAGLQIELASRVPELFALGTPDRRLARLPRLYAELLADTENLRLGLAKGLTVEEHPNLLALRPRVAALCEKLDAYGLPETLVHEEVHDANVVAGPGGSIFADWSDSCVGHPFFSMLVTLRSASHRLGLAEKGPEMARLRAIYLDSWTSFAPRPALEGAFDIAYRLGMINRSLSYYNAFRDLPQAYKIEYDGIPGWLQDFLVAETETAGLS